MVAGRGFRQAHGSPMGSPLSPVLRGMVIAAQEEIWRRTFSITCSSMSRNLLRLSLRYVDNRLWIFGTQVRADARSPIVPEQPILRRRHRSSRRPCI